MEHIFQDRWVLQLPNNIDQAYNLGMIAGKEANAVKCNWSFAPIVDIDKNFLNPITNIRTFGSDKDLVIQCAQYQMKALRENCVIPCIKLFQEMVLI